MKNLVVCCSAVGCSAGFVRDPPLSLADGTLWLQKPAYEAQISDLPTCPCSIYTAGMCSRGCVQSQPNSPRSQMHCWQASGLENSGSCLAIDVLNIGCLVENGQGNKATKPGQANLRYAPYKIQLSILKIY